MLTEATKQKVTIANTRKQFRETENFIISFCEAGILRVLNSQKNNHPF